MAAEDELLAQLAKLKASAEGDDVDHFIAVIMQLRTLDRRTELISELLTLFVDSAQWSRAMWKLMHYVESFELKAYVSTLIERAYFLSHTAPEWLTNLIRRTLNNDQTCEFFAFKCADNLDEPTRDAILAVLHDIETDAQGRGDKFAPLVAKASRVQTIINRRS